ncbi:thioesterase II family protein [Dickeya dianthicola]|uniref:thioesterase II family protein n=1 Tax=Dickeya dianthicola TaxID=204039 RepID=UPI001866998E|nr:thioesterase [Dickeya dianthicola]QOL15830.1 thioesterase [Dickeya dianthicola]
MKQPQINRLASGERARLQLFCLPYAGGTDGFYRSWCELMPPDIDLNVVFLSQESGLFGPQNHADTETLPEIARRLADIMLPHLTMPWAVFGHSMGAVLALELLLALMEKQAPPPVLLAVSAHVSPQFHQPDPLSSMSDDALCEILLEMGGTSKAMLTSPGIRKMILRAVRQDLELLIDWHPPMPQALPCAVSAFWGEEDNLVSRPAMQGWRSWTQREFSDEVFPGGHFYFSDDPRPLVERLLARIRRALASLENPPSFSTTSILP